MSNFTEINILRHSKFFQKSKILRTAEYQESQGRNKNKKNQIIASWRHQQSSPCGQWSWCAAHALEGPNSDEDHGGFCNKESDSCKVNKKCNAEIGRVSTSPQQKNTI